MTPADIEARILRYGDLLPCRSAYIDALTTGPGQKESSTIIGGGVSESPDQHVHIGIPHGFNSGAAGQPPRCRNALHDHRAAEVFFVLSSRWRFFCERWDDAGGGGGGATLAPGDTMSMSMSMPENLACAAVPSMTGDPAGLTWRR